jgi:hypothetical protein
VECLTTHHIIPQAVGGIDSIFNYFLVHISVNSHFGDYITKECVAFVGAANFGVAKRAMQHFRNLNVEGYTETTFDPFHIPPPTRAVKKRRIAVSTTMVGHSSDGVEQQSAVSDQDEGNCNASEKSGSYRVAAIGNGSLHSSSGDPHSSSIAVAFPKDIPSLLKAISDDDFGVSLDRSSKLASPAMSALKMFAESRGLEVPEAAMRHSPGDHLADGYDIIKVCQPHPFTYCPAFHPSPHPSRLLQIGQLKQPMSYPQQQAPQGMKGKDLPSILKLVSALARIRTIHIDMLASVPFKPSRGGQMELITKVARDTRRSIAYHLTPATIKALRTKSDPRNPDIGLMRTLYDSGFKQCIAQGAHLFDPAKCNDAMKLALWKAYCSIATTGDDSDSVDVAAALDGLKTEIDKVIDGVSTAFPGCVESPLTAIATMPPSSDTDGQNRITGQDVIRTIASCGRSCLLSPLTERFVTQTAKKICNDTLKEVAFIKGRGKRPEQVRYSINTEWVVLPLQNTTLTFGDFVFAANSGNAIRRLIGISRDDLLKRIDDGNSDIDNTALTFQVFETRTIPLDTLTPHSNMLPYILLSITLFDHAVTMASNPSVVDRLTGPGSNSISKL